MRSYTPFEPIYLTARLKRELDAEQAYRYGVRLRLLQKIHEKHLKKRPKKTVPRGFSDISLGLGEYHYRRGLREIRWEFRYLLRMAVSGRDREDRGVSQKIFWGVVNREAVRVEGFVRGAQGVFGIGKR